MNFRINRRQLRLKTRTIQSVQLTGQLIDLLIQFKQPILVGLLERNFSSQSGTCLVECFDRREQLSQLVLQLSNLRLVVDVRARICSFWPDRDGEVFVKEPSNIVTLPSRFAKAKVKQCVVYQRRD